MSIRTLGYASALTFAIVFTVNGSGPEDRRITDPRTVTSPVNPNAKPLPIPDLYFSRTVADPAWSPDGTHIAFTCDLTGRMNLWQMPVAGGWPLQMVQSDDRQFGAVFSKDGKWIVYQQDQGGGEYYDLYAVPSVGGAPVNLTNTPDISETTGNFSPDGKWLAISYKRKTGANVDIALLDWSARSVRKLTNEQQPDRLWSFDAWSPDAKTLYADRGNTGATDSDIYAIDPATGKAENLTPHEGELLYHSSSVSPDGKTLLVTSNAKNGAQNVALLDVPSRKLTWVTDTKWEASSADFTADGKYFTWVLNADGQTEVFLVDRSTMRSEKLAFPEGLTYPSGRPSGVSPDGKYLLLGHQSSREPGDLWMYDIAKRKARQLTFSAVASLNPKNTPQAQIIHYTSFDDKMISALLWVPFNVKRDGTSPGIVMPHGGPTGQMVDYFNTDAAALASRGYFVIAPNPRGSTGYGIEFQKANHQDLGGGDLQDEVHAADFLIKTGYVDSKKIGITGGSYGGFMTLMAIGKTPDRWAAAVEQYGIINWLTMLKHSDPLLQQYEKSLLGDPDKDRDVYEKTSPLKYIRNAKAPLLVLQGENDIRVPKEEAGQVVEILKSEGRTVEAHYYPAEGHGFSKRENQIDAITRTIDWFEKYLK